jgi:acyl carrier protein
MLVQKNVRELIDAEIRAALMEDDDETGTFSPDDSLARIGLNSLILARLLIQLETELGVDPFEDEFSITDMRTVDDLVNAYEQALASAAGS